MFGLSVSHLLLLTVVILLFGARRLPELGGSLGKSIRSFKKGLEGLDHDENPESKQAARDKIDDSSRKG